MTGFLGDNVGRAYIKILADGGGLPESIRDAWRDPAVDDEARRAGERHSKDYNDAFDEEFRKNSKRDRDGRFRATGLSQKDLRRVQEQARALTDARDRVFRERRDGWQRELAEGFRRRGAADDAADVMAKRLVRRFRKQIHEGGIGSIQRLFSDPEALNRVLRDESRRYIGEQEKRNALLDRIRTHAMRIERQQLREQGHLLAHDLRAQLTQRDALYDKFFGERGTNRHTDRIRDELTRQLRGDDASIAARQNRLLRGLRAGNRDALEESRRFRDQLIIVNRRLGGGGIITRSMRPFIRDLDNSERHLRRLDDRVDVLGRHIGRAFGRGNRNNFVNFFGSLVGGISLGLLNAPIKLGRAFLRFRGDYRAVRGDIDHSAGLFTRLRRSIRAVVDVLGTRLVRGIGAFAGAIGGAAALVNILVLILGPLAALISGLTAGILALASSIGFALIASLVTLGPLLIGIAATAGIVALAFLKMSKEQKKALSIQLKPVTSQFRKLQEATRKGLFDNIPAQAQQLHRFLGTLTPLFTGVGRSVSKFGTILLRAFNSPAMAAFIHSFSDFLDGAGRHTGAIVKLGQAFGNWLQGAVTWLRLAIPYADKFLSSLVKTSREFNTRTNSKIGQNNIADFFRRAEESGHKVFRTFRLLGQIIRDLLGGEAARGAGNTLFDMLNHNLQRFDNYITGKGIRSVHDFFNQVAPLFHSLGNFFGGFGHFFAALDSPASRAILNGFLDKLGQIFDFIGSLTPDIQAFQREAGRAFGAALRAIQPLLRIGLQALAGLLKILVPLMQAVATASDAIFNHLGPLRPVVVGVATAVVGMWLAFRGYNAVVGAGIAIRAFATGTLLAVRSGIANIIFALRTGTGQALTAREKFGAALGGLGIGIAGGALGDSVGGAGGLAISTLSGAAGGALIGSTFGPIGTGVGAAAGAIIGGVRSIFSSASDDAKRYRDQQLAYLNDVLERANGLQAALAKSSKAAQTQALQDATRNQLATPGAKGGPSVLASAETVGLDTQQLVRTLSGTGDVGDIANLYKTLDAGEATLQKLVNQYGNNSKQAIAFATALDTIRAAADKQHDALQRATRAQDTLAAAGGRLNLATRTAALQYITYGRNLNGFGINARRNTEFLRDNIDAFNRHYRVQLRSGVATRVANRALDEQIQTFKDQAVAAGFSAKRVNEIIARYLAIPGNRKIDVQTRAAEDKMNTLTRIIRNAKQGRVPGINVDTQEGRNKIAALQAELNRLTDKFIHLHGEADLQVNIGVSGAGVQSFRSGIHVSLAAGAILNSATMIRPGVQAGEAGREAVVPLNRPLSQVDPSVRWLSAIAQGKDPSNVSKPKQMASGGIINSGRNVTVEAGAFQIITPTTDPRAVAAETFNRLVATVTL